MRVPTPGVAPKGGRKFTDKDGVQFSAGSWADLFEEIYAHRESSGGNLETIQAEVYEQYCEKYPHGCRETRDPEAVVFNTPMRIYTRVITWISEVFGLIAQRRLKYQDNQTIIEKRTNICRGCTQQIAWLDHGGCQSCLPTYEKTMKQMLQGRRISAQQTGLQGCRVLGEDTRVSVHLNQPPVATDKQPDNCWRRKE